MELPWIFCLVWFIVNNQLAHMSDPMEKFYALYNLFLNFIIFFSPLNYLSILRFLVSIDQEDTRGT